MDLITRRLCRNLLPALLAVLAVAACNQAAPSVTASSPGTTPTSTAAATPPPPSPPAVTPGEPTASAAAVTSSPTSGSDTGDLGDLIPDVVAGVTLTEISVRGDDLSELPAADVVIVEGVIEAAGVDPDQVHVVTASGEALAILAVRAEGAPVEAVVDKLIEQMVAALPAAAQTTEVTVAGTNVTRISAPGSDFRAFWLFLRDDVAFVVIADEALAGQAIADLL